MACQAVTNGYRCEKNKEITISSPIDPSNPLVSHVWTIDGIEESTDAQFNKTYASPGTHTVVLTGSNACSSDCSKTVQLEIAEPPPTGAAAPKGISPLAVVAVVALGFLGIVMMKKKK